MTTSTWRTTVVNSFGTFGYISCVLQWAWTAIVLCYPIVTMDTGILFPKPAHQAPAATFELGPLSPVVFIVAVITTLLVLALTVITLVSLPKTIGNSGAKTTHTVAHVIIPTVTHHKKISKKRYISLSYRIVIGLKYMMTVLPLALLAFAPTIASLSQKIIIAVGLIAASFTVFYFSIQILLVVLLKVEKKRVW